MIILEGKEAERYFDFNRALFEFHQQFTYEVKDERAIVILGGTFLEMILEHVLRAFLPEDDKEVNNLFKQSLGNFSNKISTCYCLGLIDKVIKNDLTLIRQIRNKFAHELFISFENPEIQKWCSELKWHRIAIMQNPPSEATSLDYFQVGVNTLISHLSGCVSIARGEKRSVKNNYEN
ncbi:MAG: hypothetical protein RL308_1559, partial [Bacteroidota bacterium]